MNDNKYMFEAKRLDNGEMIQGSLIHSCGGYSIHVESYNPGTSYSISSHDIDPSTIKPLFTTEPNRDAYLFENADKSTYRNLTQDQQKIIHDQIMIDVSMVQCYEMQDRDWIEINHDYSSVFFGAIYRVKAPFCSIDDAMTDARNATEEAGAFGSEDMVVMASDVVKIIRKLAKAHGLD